MRYRVFFQIEIVHPYFSTAAADLIILPDAQTTLFLSKQRFLIRRTINGIKILRAINENDEKLTAIEVENVFVFNIFPTSENVREFTDTSMVETGKMLLFSNEGLSKGNVELMKSKTFQEGKYQNFPAIARVEIKGGEIISQSNGSPHLYKALFQSRAIKWKYYFVSNSKTTDLAIATRDQQLKFTQLEIKEDFSDKIVQSLTLNFQDTKIIVFESNIDIPYSKTPIKNINLKQNGLILINHLPNPEVQDNGIQIIKI
ncbi:hypothetical protein FIA58_000110 [Flavobacterium jejuense]|uniref:Uncharacterized protein n=1 Tax=Flavobacterium jejuense TaxID=1544455 RepID=A0ABX0IJQ5_9FLAO|nr:hypothetical protein [Flavobacterium jejuense]NHN24065.1 hypothetical protein [Flavobacterium jejuense]